MNGGYSRDTLNVGDWIIVGQGYMAVGWNSACDWDTNRKIAHRVYQIKSIRKTVVPVGGHPGDRFEFDQVLAVFDSKGSAEAALRFSRAAWEDQSREIKVLEGRLGQLRAERFQSCVRLAKSRTNR